MFRNKQLDRMENMFEHLIERDTEVVDALFVELYSLSDKLEKLTTVSPAKSSKKRPEKKQSTPDEIKKAKKAAYARAYYQRNKAKKQ